MQERAEAAHQAKIDVVWELQHLSVASRARVNTLLITNEHLDWRIHDLSQQLLAAVPVRTYALLADKYNALLSQKRDNTIERSQAIVQAENSKNAFERQLAAIEQLYVAASIRAASAEEASRNAERLGSLQGDAREGELLGNLQQRAVELQNSKLQTESAERRSRRIEEELKDKDALLVSVQEGLAQKAKGVDQPNLSCVNPLVPAAITSARAPEDCFCRTGSYSAGGIGPSSTTGGRTSGGRGIVPPRRPLGGSRRSRRTQASPLQWLEHRCSGASESVCL